MSIFEAYGSQDPAGSNQPPITSPGQPTGGGGMGKGGKFALAAGLAPLIAFLGSKMSGGGLSFGEGLASLGTGYAKSSYDNLKQKRDADFQREGELLDAAHKLVTVDIPKMNPLILQKYPDLDRLAKKYTMALSEGGDGGKTITPKEQQEIITQYHLASQQMGVAQREQADEDVRGKQLLTQQGEAAELTGANIPDPSVSEEERAGLVAEGMGDIASGKQSALEAEKAKAAGSIPKIYPGFESFGPITQTQLGTLQAKKMEIDSRREENAKRRTLQMDLVRERLGGAAGRQAVGESGRAYRAWVGRRAKYITDNINNPDDQAERHHLSDQYDAIDPPPSAGGGGLHSTPAPGGGKNFTYVPGKGLIQH